MRLLLLNHIENARESLRANKLRTRLTVLGITLGVASMTAIMAMSFGAIQLVDDQVKALGGNILLVRPGSDQKADYIKQLTTSPVSDSFTASPLTEKDLEAIKKVPGVEQVAPLMSVGGSLKSQHTTIANMPIVATTPNLESISKLVIQEGQFIGGTSNLNTAVIGSQLAVDLFGTNRPIGQTFKIKGQTFAVIGTFRPVSDAVSYNDIDFNRTAVINFESGKSFNQGIAQIRQINVQAKQGEDISVISKRIEETIGKQHDGERDFSVLSGSQISQPTAKMFASVTATSIIIAIISLIIGGIGIMNIMLVSVAERTREIGIRKAVGASNYHITMQFLIESLAISLWGGVTGLLLGYVIAFAASTILPFAPGITWFIPVVSIGVALLVGSAFGIYPALRAARKNPIEALRQYN